MIRRLNNNIAYALIASAVGLSGYGVAGAADNAAATAAGESKSAAAPATPSASTGAATSTSGASASTTAPVNSDQSVAPRGTNPTAATNTTAGNADSPAKRIFDQLDTNHDGSLSLEEFSRATFQQPAK
ncbi:MAG TPA: EF-hand domain-containing protein [Casimicrobiaceae bacterium]|nr:EF-hand domain-containing protein [Casimicrobiaceae bacterium]